MKTLISIIGGVGILASSFSPMISLDQSNNLLEKDDRTTRDSIFYFNNKKEWIFNAKATAHGPGTDSSDHQWSWKNINLGNNKPTFSTMEFLSAPLFEIDWGSTHKSYRATDIMEIEFNSANNFKINNEKDAEKVAKKLQSQDEWKRWMG